MTNSTPPRSLVDGPGVDGLIWAYHFAADGSARPVEGAAALGAGAAEGWTWLHFDLADTRTRGVIAALPDLSARLVEVLTDQDEHPHLLATDGLLGGVVADFIHADTPELRQMTAWHFVMGPRRLVTARRRQSRVIGELHAALRAGRRFPDVLHLFDGLVDGFADTLAAMVRRLAERLDAVEDALLDQGETEFEELGLVRRDASRLHRLMPPLCALLRGIVARPPAWFVAPAMEECAEVARRVESLAADVAALQERAHALQDEIASRQAAQTNQRLAVLSVITALLMPPTLISGIFGMNVARVPFVEEGTAGFPAAMGLIFVSVVVMVYVLRRLRLF